MSVTLSPPAIAAAIPTIPALLGYGPQEGQLTVLHMAAEPDTSNWRIVGCHATQPGSPDHELPTALAAMDAEANRLGLHLHGRLAVTWSRDEPAPELTSTAEQHDYTIVQASYGADKSVQWRYPGIIADPWRATDGHGPLMAELVRAGVNTQPTATWYDRLISQWAPNEQWAATVAGVDEQHPVIPGQLASLNDGVALADQMWDVVNGTDRAAAGAAVIATCTGPLWMRDLIMMRAAKNWRAAEDPFAAAVSAADPHQVAAVASAAAFAAASHGEVGLATRLTRLAATSNGQHSLTRLMNRWVSGSADPSIIRSLVATMSPAEIIHPALTTMTGQTPPAAAANEPKPGRGL